MTDLLEKAFEEAAKLPPEEQDGLAAVILAELESERKWEEAIAGSQDVLSELADEAFEEYEAGDTEPLMPPGPGPTPRRHVDLVLDRIPRGLRPRSEASLVESDFP